MYDICYNLCGISVIICVRYLLEVVWDICYKLCTISVIRLMFLTDILTAEEEVVVSVFLLSVFRTGRL